MNIYPENCTDAYKQNHKKMYPDGTEFVYSNFTPRSDKLFRGLPDFDHKYVHFGPQYVAIDYFQNCWNQHFFQQPKHKVIFRFKRRMDKAFGPGAISADHMEALHDLQHLPLLIKSLPEGSRVNMRVPPMTIINTHKDFAWTTNFVETPFSTKFWVAPTNATIAYEFRRYLDSWAEETGTPIDFVAWQGHDFSMRGMSSIEAASLSGAAHLTSFFGTDTFPAFDLLEDYYGGMDTFLGGSVPATEHSIMCAGGNGEGQEIATYKRLIYDLFPSGIISIVSDTWNLWDVLTIYNPEMKDIIINRRDDSFGNAKVVFRPDSGDPVKIVCGEAWPIEGFDDWSGPAEAYRNGFDYVTYDGKYFNLRIDSSLGKGDEVAYIGEEVEATPELKGTIDLLWDVFGGTVNGKGFKVLDRHVGCIYGDSINLERLQMMRKLLTKKGYASSCMVFGIGSFTYQYNTRDSLGTAMKATWAQVNGVGRALYKEPFTDRDKKTGISMKKSAQGLLRVEFENGNFVLYDNQTPEQEKQGLLRPIFENSKILHFDTIKEIRKRLHPGWTHPSFV